MFKDILIVIAMILSTQLKGQSVDISFSLVDSCLNYEEKTTAIYVVVKNSYDTDVWIDLESINFTVYHEDKVAIQTEEIKIGLFSPEEKISKDGFLLVRKMNSEGIIIHTSIFRNYMLDLNKTYCLKGFYKNARSRRNIYDVDIAIGKINFKIYD